MLAEGDEEDGSDITTGTAAAPSRGIGGCVQIVPAPLSLSIVVMENCVWCVLAEGCSRCE